MMRVPEGDSGVPMVVTRVSIGVDAEVSVGFVVYERP